MFSILKLIIWLAGMLVVISFVLPYFGYEINTNYWKERKEACQKKLNQCQKNLINTGIQGAKDKCDFRCVDPKLIIRKQNKDAIMDTETGATN